MGINKTKKIIKIITINYKNKKDKTARKELTKRKKLIKKQNESKKETKQKETNKKRQIIIDEDFDLGRFYEL